MEHARAELADAEQRYGPDHPDRISLQREVTTLEGELAAMPADAGASSTAPVEADNPAYVQIQAQLSATKNDLAALQEQMAKLRAQIEEYQRNISLSPQVEKRYHELTRDYENARLKYAEVRSKQQEAKAAQNLEADRKGERFTLIDPPLPPERPVSPNRVLILALGLVLSVGLAVGTLMMTERFDTSIRGRSDLQELLGTAPLALVPYIVTKAEIRAAWRRMWATAGSAVAAVCVAVVLVHLFYRPLDVLWFSVSRRFGLG